MYDDEVLPPLGIVPVVGRGALPYALVHGESLVACASWALGEAEVDLVDFNVEWPQLRESGRPLVLHDPLCPLTPAAFLVAAIERAAAEDQVVVGVRPVTDTVKRLDGDRVGATVDRESLLQVASPIVIPARVLAGLTEAPDLSDLAALASALREVTTVCWLEAPATARRICEESEIELLEAISHA
ncbi:MAG: 2-C-methyl-D-erythritol 4-phosphate cytidylyltransferase [Marmoricola sp.]